MVKIQIVRRLGADWRDLAGLLEVRGDEQQRIDRTGDPRPRDLGLALRPGPARRAAGALTAIGRADLAALVATPAAAPQAVDFSALIDERTEEFVGRRTLARTLWETFDDPAFGSGYLVVTGEPGIGKTALLASLVQRHGLVHHFNSALTGVNTTERFLGNVCAQLVAAYGLPQQLPADVTSDSATLLRLLGEAVRTGRVVVAVDALDEARDGQAGSNRLLLPPALPRNTYVLLTLRTTEGVPLYVDERRELTIDERAAENVADVREFATTFVGRHRETMTARLAALDVHEAGFTETLCDRSEGNLMYVRHVLHGIRDQTLGGLGVDVLPRGLQAYYAQLEQQLGVVNGLAPERQLKILAVLATWPEPLAVTRLAAYAGEAAGSTAAVVRRWGGLLNRVDEAPPRFALYHASFRDFLAERLDLAAVRSQIMTTIDDELP